MPVPGRLMRLYAIACDVVARPVYLCAARSPHVVDVRLFERGLHNEPKNLRARLQEAIDDAPAGAEAVVLGYGLCGGATAGIVARDVPVVLPRAHDCITLFLGARERYAEEHASGPRPTGTSRTSWSATTATAPASAGSPSAATPTSRSRPSARSTSRSTARTTRTT